MPSRSRTRLSPLDLAESFHEKAVRNEWTAPSLQDSKSPGSTPQLEVFDYAEMAKRLEAGLLRAEDVPDAAISGIVRGVTDENRNVRRRFAGALFGRGTLAERTTRTAIDESWGWGRGKPPSMTLGRVGRAKQELRRIKETARTLGEQTGFDVSLPSRGRVGVYTPKGEVFAMTLTSFLTEFATNPQFKDGAKAARLLAAGAPEEDVKAAMAPVFATAASGHKAGDGWLYHDPEKRRKAAETALAAYRDPDKSLAERQAAAQAFLNAVGHEAFAHKRTQEFLLDLVPILGNYRSGEDMVDAVGDVRKAHERGDTQAVLLHSVRALLGAAGAVAGVAPGVSAVRRVSTSKTTRQGMRESAAHLKDKAVDGAQF